MKKINFLLVSLLALLTGLTKANAEVTYPYLVDFNTAIDVSSETFVPADGWEHRTDGANKNMYGDLYYPTYTYNATGGVDGSGYLEAGTQTLLDKVYKEDQDCKDMLVTPEITGKATIYVKSNGKSNSFFDVYVMKKNKFDKWAPSGSAIIAKSSSDLGDGWVKVEIGDFTEATYLGLHASNMGMDNFEVTQAAAVKKSVKLKILTAASDDLSPLTDADRNYKLKFTLTVVNDGEADIKADDADCTITLINYDTNAEIATIPLGADIAVGEEKELPIEFTLSYDKYPKSAYYKLRDNLSNTTATCWSTFNPKLNEPQISVGRSSGWGTYDIPADLTWDLGFMPKGDTLELLVGNKGQKELHVTEILTTGDITVASAEPFSVAKDGKDVPLTVIMNGDKVGDKAGTLTIKSDGGDFTVNFTGTVINPATTWYEGFETSSKIPAGMEAVGSPQISAKSAVLKTTNNLKHFYMYSYSSPVGVITPLLDVAEGDVLHFMASIASSRSPKSLFVYYSADKKDWTLAKEFTAEELTSTAISSYYTLNRHEVSNIPAGKYYVKFESAGAYIDDTCGIKAVELDHNMKLTATSIPTSGSVNTTIELSATFYNDNLKAEKADDYTVKFYLDGEAVATAQSKDIESGAEATFPFSYTAHEPGSHEMYIEFLAGDYSVKTDAVTVEFAPESADKDVVTGTAKKLANSAPVNVYSEQSSGVVLYPASKLAGLSKGDKIQKIVFKGWGAWGSTGTPYTSHLTVYIQNTKSSFISEPIGYPTSTTGMTKIYDDDYTWPVTAKSASDQSNLNAAEPMLTLNLAEPFEYDGDNIKMTFVNMGESYRNVKFELEESASNLCWVINGNNIEDIDYDYGPFFEKQALPVAHFIMEGKPSIVSGTVKDKSGNAIAGADITLKSGEVEYYGKSDNEGNYTVKALKGDLSYEATATAEGYDAATASGALDGTPADVELALADKTYADAAKEAVVLPISIDGETAAQFGKFYYLTSYAEGVATFNLAKSVTAYTPYIFVPNKDVKLSDLEALIAEEPKSFNTLLDATKLNDITAEGLTFAGMLNRQSIVSAADNNVLTFDGEQFVKTAAENAYSLPLSAVLKTTADVETVTVVLSDVATGINGVNAEAAGDGKIYTISGIEVGKNAKNLQPGVYVKNGKKFIVR